MHFCMSAVPCGINKAQENGHIVSQTELQIMVRCNLLTRWVKVLIVYTELSQWGWKNHQISNHFQLHRTMLRGKDQGRECTSPVQCHLLAQ